MNISDLYDGEDFESTFSKEQFETLLKKDNYGKKIESLLDKCVEKCKIEVTEVDGIVIAGGTCRIPFIQNKLQTYLKDKMEKSCGLNKSVNMDEHISYGCSYYGLILNNIWNYEIIDNDDNELLLSSCNVDTRNRIMEMNDNLCNFLCGFNNMKIENKERMLLYDYYKDGLKLISSTINIGSINQYIDGVDYDTHLQEADKARNEMESLIYDIQRDLKLIQDRAFMEKENDYLTKVIEELHTDKSLMILHSVKEYEKKFYDDWNKKKESKLPLAMILWYNCLY